jgi:outer membrane PBP1 activator LpoA protein
MLSKHIVPTTVITPAELLAQARSAPLDEAVHTYLDAGWAFIESDDLTRSAVERGATEAYEAIEPGLLPLDRLSEFHLLAARIALFQRDAQLAALNLAEVAFPASESSRALLIRSELCALEGDHTCALTTLVHAAGETTDFNEAIWQTLNRGATMASLEQPTDPAADPVLSQWRALHALTIQNAALMTMGEEVADWLQRHPAHPASLEPPAAIGRLVEYRGPSRHVGLFLPLSGPLSRAGEAVRDGFIASALITRGSSADAMASAANLHLTIYDTSAEPVPSLYERALGDGVDLIVGPLQKTTVTDLNALNPEVPVLVLNYLDTSIPAAANVIQFGLAIEDEAGTIVARLERDGIRSALLFHNYDDWSMRARRAVEDGWSNDLTVQPFTDMRTITEAVGAAMHVSDSQARKDELAAVLGHQPEFLPRARTDVHGVIALVDNVEANALVPALNFHFANHLPVYASSQVTRRIRSGQLAELSGFHVSELPWFLEGNRLHTLMEEPLQLDGNPFASLVALGSDGFYLAERIGLLGPSGGESLLMLGSTGLLTLTDDGRISRELAWGTISGAKVNAETGGGP